MNRLLNLLLLLQLNQYYFLESETREETIKSLELSAYLNLSLCHLKLGDNYEAFSAATNAVEIDPKNEKAYFRQGQASLKLDEPAQASKQFSEVLRLEPNNQAAKAQLVICNKMLSEQLKKEKKIYANMFDKFAKSDTQVKTN